MKRILPIALFLCSSFFLSAQSGINLQNLLEQDINRNQILSSTDCESVLDSTVYLRIFDGMPDYDRRVIYEYDDQHREIKESIEYYSGIDEVFQLRNVYDTEYSENERTVFREDYEQSTDSFTSYSRTVTVLNNNMPESYTFDRYDELSEEYVPSRIGTYTYFPESNYEQEREVKIWNELFSQYDPFLRYISYREDDVESSLDSFVIQSYDTELEMWTPSRSYHLIYDTENRLVEFNYYRAFDIGEELTLWLKDSLVYVPDSENYTLYERRSDSFTSADLELNTIRHINVVNDLTVSDSIFRKNIDTGEFLLDEIDYYSYDEEGRRILIVTQMENLVGDFGIVRQRSDHYQICETSAVDATTNTIDCRTPNPIHNGQIMSCTMEDRENCKVKLYDLLGRQVFKRKIGINEDIHFEQLPINGVYFLTVEDKSQILMRQKVIVSN